MSLVLIGKCLVLGGWPSDIEVIGALGTYSMSGWFDRFCETSWRNNIKNLKLKWESVFLYTFSEPNFFGSRAFGQNNAVGLVFYIWLCIGKLLKVNRSQLPVWVKAPQKSLWLITIPIQIKVVFQASLYYKPKQCTFVEEIPQNLQFPSICINFDPPKTDAISWPDVFWPTFTPIKAGNHWVTVAENKKTTSHCAEIAPTWLKRPRPSSRCCFVTRWEPPS